MISRKKHTGGWKQKYSVLDLLKKIIIKQKTVIFIKKTVPH